MRQALVPVLALAFPAAALAQPASVSREELQQLAVLLDAAVERASPANADVFLAGTASCRPYLLRGYGVVFVVPPRTLPMEPVDQVQGFRPWPPPVTRRPGTPMTDEEKKLRVMEQQAAEFVAQAEQFSREAELAFITMMQELEQRLAADQARALAADRMRPQVAASAVAERPAERPAPAAESPGADEPTPLPDVRPGPPPAGPRTYLPAPPWKRWIGGMASFDARPPERVVADVREAVTAVLEAFGPNLSAVNAEESVSVVVDFVSGAPFLDDVRPARSLTVRIRKKDLEERRAGRLTAEELRRRLEAVEY
jgi:hypothetical protein